ncbi:hypothetical protein DRN98_10380 [Methanosarcinales archaeon]|nr:MAG: hypothetical protein DRN98_10380 [Methanosarcinales archaeon]
MSIPEFKTVDTLKKLWWLHDSFWHAVLIREFGPARANRFNLEVSEKLFRMLTNTLLREKIIQRPDTIQDLMSIFKAVWKNAFFENLYVDNPIVYNGNTAIWTGTRCHAYDSLKRAGLLEGYECGCQALRSGVMKALRLQPLHEIKESLVNGDERCVIEITFSQEKQKITPLRPDSTP